MIRHTINIKADPQLHQGQLSCCLQGLKDGDCVKVTQADRNLYLTYRLSEKMAEKQTSVHMQLMMLNDVEEGSCVVEPFSCGKMEHLAVRVSELDWKIVNKNKMRIAQSFLEQITIVWPGAVIPIYYDQHNFVKLIPLCDKVGRLDVNTTVQFIEEEKEKGEEDEEEQKQDVEEVVALNSHCQFQQGWLNVITISKQLMQALQIENNQPWIVQNMLDFTNCPSIDELVDLQKAREAADSKEEPSNKKLVLLTSDQLNQLSKNKFQCSKLCKKIVGISDSLKIDNKSISKPHTQLLSFQILMNDSNWSIHIEQLIKDQFLYNEIQFQQLAAKMMKMFIKEMVDALYKKGVFYFMSEVYPYCIDKHLLVVRLEHKKKKKSSGVVYEVKLTGQDSSTKKGFYQNELQNKVIFFSRKYPPSLPSTLEQRYQEISKWVQVIKQYMDQQKQRHEEESKEDSMVALSTCIYQPQIDKIMNFIENTSIDICLLTSLGSNGKTLLHRILEREGERMWKIGFRELTNPNLTFTNIQLYLHYIFSNSPYPIIYLDDLDALCPKIQQSDQHKKKEKVISKLILRTIRHYLSLYSKRIIVTSKSQNNLDEEFKPSTVISLKNPNHEQRVSALKTIHVVVQPDDSPIHIYAKQLPGTRKVTEEKVKTVAEHTQSLTLAAFSKHAINLTTPTTNTTTTTFDFSKLAGLATAKSAIRNIIEKPIKYAFLFKSVPIKLPRGVLLYGATGNGKSALGTSLKDEFKMKYFTVKGSDILSKYIGGSQAAVRDIFEKALSVSPSIIFFDQFESIVPRRSSNNTGVNDRIVNQFLCYLDGVSSISGVYIIAASSRPDLIDPAVLRPGRLDAHFFLDYPNEEERRELIHLFKNSVAIELAEQTVIKETQNFSYSDMIGLMKELRIKRSAEVLQKEEYKSQQFTKIGEQLFRKTIGTMKISVNPSDQIRQRKIYQAFRDGKTPDIGKQKHIQY